MRLTRSTLDRGTPSPSKDARLLHLYADILGPILGRETKDHTALGTLLRVEHGWLSLRQAGAYLGTSEWSVRKLVRQGRLRALQPNYPTHSIYIAVEDCRKLLAESPYEVVALPGCDNSPLAQSEPKKKSKPKSGKR